MIRCFSSTLMLVACSATAPVSAGPAAHATHSAYVVMKDGTKIAVDYFIPVDSDKKSFPAIFTYTPYQRSTIDPVTGAVNDWGSQSDGRFFLSQGYALVRADMRGTGASTGWLLDFMDELGRDGAQIVEWIAEQPWCDGNVGMTGGSYLGWSQTATARHAPKALKCINPIVVPLEGYTGEVYPGGVYLQGFLELWAGFMFYGQRNYNVPEKGFRPAKPVIDGDGDGEYLDEIPVDKNGNGTFLDDGEPEYADGNERAPEYYTATKEHERNLDYASWAEKALFIDALSPLKTSLNDSSPSAHLSSIMQSRIPVYIMGGWFDGFARGVVELYATMRETNQAKLLVFPGYHDILEGPFYEHIGADRGEAAERFQSEQLRFFDRYLKGIKNGIENDSPMTYYAMNGAGWTGTEAWPRDDTQFRTLHFSDANTLGETASKEGSDDYTADFTHDTRYGSSKSNRWLSIGGLVPDTLPIRNHADEKCLVYTGPVLTQPLEVTGHPIVHLWVSSTADEGDFFVYIEDVNESGESILVTEAQLGANYAAPRDNDLIITNHPVNVLPELPWHGYRKQDYVEWPLADGRIIEIEVDFQPTSWTFKTGHRIRVAIACADFPTYRLHRKLSPENDPAAPANVVPTITVHRGGSHNSRIELPVVAR